MGHGDFGGDGSVRWVVLGNKVRTGSVRSITRSPRKHEHRGIDETKSGLQKFTVTIKIPKGDTARNRFAQVLQKAADQAKVGATKRISVRLPIEDQNNGGPNHNQIRVRWPSR